MPDFRYSARSQQGIVAGIVHSADCMTVATQLLAQQLEPLTIEPLQERHFWQTCWHRLARSATPGAHDLILFTRQMVALIHAGVPLIQALQGIRGYAHHALLQETLGKVIEALQSGRDLASALAAYPHIFGRLFPRLVRVGEQTGRLEESFQQMFQYLERDRAVRRRLQTALRYPLLVLAATWIALLVVNCFVIPAFAGLFARFGAELPPLTRLLVTTSRFTQAYWPMLLLGMAGLGYVGWALRQTRLGREVWDQQILRLPLVGSLIQRALLARLTRTFAMGTRSGLTVAQTLHLVGETLDNRCMARQLAQIHDRVERGEPLTQAAQHSGLFPPMVLQMLAVGEQTGHMGDMLLEVADFYDREVEYELQALSAWVEPVLILMVACLVLLLALGIFLPMWNLGSVALGRR
ncbi:MAG: type II secretion system F family protein [Magnetococcales bacterium]|nr:type II secretion system F family protein [Magnetococcales bacterium]